MRYARARVARRYAPLAVLGLVAAVLPPASTSGVAFAAGSGPDAIGAFGAPFSESGPECTTVWSNDPETKGLHCRPAGVSVVVLPDGRILYWDGLEGTERIKHGTALEIGAVSSDDQSRLLTLGGTPAFSQPSPVAGGANPGGNTPEYLIPNAPAPLDQFLNDTGGGDGALFCSNQVLLANGDVLSPGGTDYYEEPHIFGRYGVSELEGLKATRVFHRATNTWTATGPMQYGRWYPSLVTLPSGKVFVASGVTKLLKPIYPKRPADSGRNVVQTETFNPSTGTWSYNGTTADRSLPLYPRLHLLPDGKVYFDAAGQTFNPFGQAYDELNWNFAAVYDPASHRWKKAGIPLVGTAPGFRGSTFSTMLTLKPPYTTASFLTAGGVMGVSPGGYLAIKDSRIATVDTAAGDATTWTSTGDLNNARWFSSATLLPTGQVMTFSGASADEVDLPGTGFPVHQAEMFDPATGTWTPMASSPIDRTYHNSATLLPDGRVLVSGHAPIPTGYGAHQTIPGGFSDNHRNTTFEIYSPPYVFWAGRPSIASAPSNLHWGTTFTVSTPDAPNVQSVVLARNTATTHLVDGDQRMVQLQIVSRTATSLTLAAPPNGAVAPAGPYLLFVNATTSQGVAPSVAKQLFVGP